MRKIKTVFVIDRAIDMAVDNVTPGMEWVLAGEGRATLKIDGTPVRKEDGVFFRRQARRLRKNFAKLAKAGQISVFEEHMYHPAPEGWVEADRPANVTGHWPGWVPLNGNDKWFNEAVARLPTDAEDGTFELVGPTVQRNMYDLDHHALIRHGDLVADVERSFDGIRQFLEENYIEGVVFHRENGDMAKVRRKDFGIEWNPLNDPRDRDVSHIVEVPAANLSFANSPSFER